MILERAQVRTLAAHKLAREQEKVAVKKATKSEAK